MMIIDHPRHEISPRKTSNTEEKDDAEVIIIVVLTKMVIMMMMVIMIMVMLMIMTLNPGRFPTRRRKSAKQVV